MFGPKQVAHIALHEAHTLVYAPFPINGYVPCGQLLAITHVPVFPVDGFL